MNLEDVAERAGVSTATVSRVLNGIGVVRSSTRARVMRAVEELKYYPNIHARALAGGRSKTLGLIVSNLENPFFLDIFRTLEEEARRGGYEVIVAHTGYDAARLKSAVGLMLGRRPAGLAMVVAEEDPSILDELENRQVRTVVYDVGAPRPLMTSIKANYRKGMQRIVEYLHSLGHRRMAFIGHHLALGPVVGRRQTFLDIVQQYGESVEHTTVADADGYEGGREAVRELYRSGFRPTAILCVNDFMAIGVLRELRDRGIAVPAQVSVTGFDNIELSEMVNPALTTAHVPRGQIGRQIFDCLVRDSEDERKAGREILIDPELVVRESTGPAAG